MSQDIVSGFINLAHLSTGRRRYAYGKILKIFNELSPSDDAGLQSHIKEGLAKDEATAALEQRYHSYRVRQEGPRANAQLVDYELDRIVGALYRHLDDAIIAFGPDSPDGQRASDMKLTLFPSGAVAITSLAFEDELAATTDLVHALQGRFAPDVKRLGYKLLVDALHRATEQFRTELGQAPSEEVTFDQVRQARSEAQHHLARLVAKLIAADSLQDQERARLFAPVIEQSTRVQDLRARRRSVPEVDPDTGEEKVGDENEQSELNS